jgi:hypothetical protein
MSVEWFRDLAITLVSVVGIAVLVFFSFLGYSLYMQTKALLKAIKEATEIVEEISARAQSNWAKVNHALSLAESIGRGIQIVTDIISNIRNTRRGKNE